MRRSSDAVATTTFFPFAALRWRRPERLQDVFAIAAGLGFTLYLLALAHAPFGAAPAKRVR